MASQVMGELSASMRSLKNDWFPLQQKIYLWALVFIKKKSEKLLSCLRTLVLGFEQEGDLMNVIFKKRSN